MNKILFLSPLPPPHYGSAISSEMCLGILNEDKRFKVHNIKINYSVDMADIGKLNRDKILGFFKVRRQVRKELVEFKPDIVYFVPATSGLGLIRDYLLVSKIKRYCKNVILHVRSRITDSDWNNLIYRAIYKRMFEKTKVIVLGDSLKSDIHGIVKEGDLFVLPNAIKNELGEDEVKKFRDGRLNGPFNILFLSNMDETKGWFKLIQACTILKSRGIEFECDFVGEFPSKREENKFKNYVEDNKLKLCVKYLGKMIGKDKNKVLSKAQVLVFPTEYKLETFGRVIIEGMMFGLPVIANGIATIPSIVKDNVSGYVLKKNTPQEIAEFLIKLHLDKKKRFSMGLEGRKIFLRNFELRNYAPRFKRIIKLA